MIARKACVLLGPGALLLAGMVLAVLLLAPLQGAVFAVLAIGGLALLGLTVLAFTSALQVTPGQMLGDNVAPALLDVILSAL